MKHIFPRLGIPLLLVVVLTACTLPLGSNPTVDTGIVATKVAATLAVLTLSAQLPTLPTQTSPTSIQPTVNQVVTQTPSATISFTITPSYTISPTITVGPSDTPIPAPGAIEGNIYGYPYGSIPALAVVAFKQNSATFWFVITGPGNTYYSMTDSSNKGYVSTGSYQVVAYDSSGHSGGCTINVQVISNQTLTCDITNWGGGYPAKPSDVPTP
jgi:hypothetical protein